MYLIKYYLALMLALGVGTPIPVIGQNNNTALQLKTNQSMLRLSATDVLNRSFGPSIGQLPGEKTVGVFTHYGWDSIKADRRKFMIFKNYQTQILKH
ncbi:hypothetical protein [Niabella hibiscisoli]|uniref:hypothetical protein n=1 Tax=Niabella hibiscisoli TaxID=1825928 RepID=UPI001F110EE8|nr:hypothetical protein [Niabella hibiscisoli]MCH5718988.1 hypothetical protein [Niabella hibiscisoli]